MLGKDLGCPEKVFSNIALYGNTTAGTIPIALSECVEAGKIKAGDLVCLVSFGAGFAWGAILLRY
jgi:3-oxoacyl-[acyl-carrier-protein] synthase-3